MSSEKIVMEGNARRRFPWTGAAAFVLSLLLAASVAALIYMSVSGAHLSCQSGKPQKGEEIVTNLNVDVNGQKEKTKVDLDTGRDIAIFEDSVGNLLAEDYKKGISIMKSANSSNCLVIPTGSDRSKENSVKSFLRGYRGQELSPKTEQYEVSLLPGQIRDTSFLPEAMNDRCDSYQWVAIASENDGFEISNTRQKRADDDCRYRYCSYYLYKGDIYRVCYYFTASCDLLS